MKLKPHSTSSDYLVSLRKRFPRTERFCLSQYLAPDPSKAVYTIRALQKMEWMIDFILLKGTLVEAYEAAEYQERLSRIRAASHIYLLNEVAAPHAAKVHLDATAGEKSFYSDKPP